MKKFRFKLQAALDYAEHREEVEGMELNTLLMEGHKLSRKQSQTLKRLRQAEEELSRKKEILPDEILLYDRFIASLRRLLEELARRLAALETKLASQREVLLEATQKRKTLDRLRQHQQDEYTARADRIFQQESDDLYLLRLGRQQATH